MVIETEEQYIDNINQIKALQAYLDSFEDGHTPASAPAEMSNPMVRKFYLDGTRSMLEQFQREVAEFEAANPRDHFAVSATK